MRKLTSVFLATITTFVAGCTAPILSSPPSPAEQIDLPMQIHLPTPTPQTSAMITPSQQAGQLPELHNWGRAPKLTNAEWLNSLPLRLADLRGKVVAVAQPGLQTPK